MDFYDLCIQDPNDDVLSKAVTLGWENPSSYNTHLASCSDWGDVKRSIDRHRENNHIVAVEGGNNKINRESVCDPRTDVILHPGRGRKDSGLDRGIVQNASRNNVSIGLDFSRLLDNDKQRTHVLSEWRKNISLCLKYNAGYVVTTGAEEKYDLRHPRDLASLIDSLGFSGSQALQKSREIIEKNRRKIESDTPSGVWKK